MPRRRPYLDAGQSRNPVADLPEKLDPGLAVRKLAAARAKPHRDDVIGGKSRRHALELDETLDQQSGASEEHQRECHFGDDQETAQPAARTAKAALALRIPSPSLEPGMEIGPRRADCWRQAKDDAGEDRYGERERENRSVDAEHVEPRDVAGIDRPYDIETRQRDQQADRPAHQAEQHALEKQLSHQALPRRAERGADRHFFLAAGGTRQQQVGDIRAGDQQHERDRSEEHEHCPAHVADDLLEQRNDADGKRPVALVLVANPGGNHAHIGLRVGHRHTRLEARHDVVVLVSPPGHGIGAERQRQEDVHPPDARDRRHDLVVQQKIRTEHAGDRELVLSLPRSLDDAVHRDAAADDVRIRVEDASPEAMTENHDRRLARRVLFGQEQPAVERSRAQQVKQARRRPQRFDTLRLIEAE